MKKLGIKHYIRRAWRIFNGALEITIQEKSRKRCVFMADGDSLTLSNEGEDDKFMTLIFKKKSMSLCPKITLILRSNMVKKT